MFGFSLVYTSFEFKYAKTYSMAEALVYCHVKREKTCSDLVLEVTCGPLRAVTSVASQVPSESYFEKTKANISPGLSDVTQFTHRSLRHSPSDPLKRGGECTESVSAMPLTNGRTDDSSL